jgi:hypothetical protein
MPDHITFILRHAAFGGLIALAFVGGILALDIAGIRHLVTHTAEGPLALAVFTMFCWITFGSVQVGIRIMSLGDDENGGGTRAPQHAEAPVAVPVRIESGRGRV